MLRLIFIFLILLLGTISNIYSQCNNGTLYPSETAKAPFYQNESIITLYQYAGDYALVAGYNFEKEYEVTSSGGASDYISIYTLEDVLVAHGPSPLSFIGPSFNDTLKVNFNLISPPCGSEEEFRETKIACTDCPSAENVGIGNTNPHETAILDLSNSKGQGFLLPKTSFEDTIPTPAEGLVLYNYIQERVMYFDGTEWVYLQEKINQIETITISGAAFSPALDCDHGFSIYNGKYTDGTSLIAPLNLPSGAIINKLTYYIYDNSSSNAEIKLSFSSSINTSVSSSTFIFSSSGSSTTIQSSTFNTNVVIQEGWQYYFLFNPSNSTLDSNLSIKAVEVEYLRPF